MWYIRDFFTLHFSHMLSYLYCVFLVILCLETPYFSGSEVGTGVVLQCAANARKK